MKTNQKLSIAALALFLSLASVSTVQAQEDQRIETTVQTRAAGNWVNVKGNWYYKLNGVNQTGWVLVDGTWYHLNAKGIMEKGWIVVGGAWYYLNADGSMATGWTVVDGAWYYLDASGAMATGWIVLDGTWYYLNANGSMAQGWLLESGSWFFLNADGSMATDWIIVHGSWYYLDLAGRMLTNTTLGNWVIDSNGVGTEIIKTNKELLTEAIAAVEDLKEINYRADGSWAKFIQALAEAKVVVKDKKATELEMAVALTALDKATDELVVLTANKVELFRAIKAEEAKKLEEVDYTAASWKAYQAVLKEAQRVYEDATVLQSEVEEAISALEKVELEIILIGRPALKAAIASAEENYLIDERIEEDYTTKSWAAFKVAYYEAQTVYAKEDYTDAVIQKAIDDLEKAIDQLVPAAGDFDELADLLEVLQVAKETAKLKADFSTKSFGAFDKALTKADTVFKAQEASSSKEIRAAKAELEKTMANLVNVKELKNQIALAEEITNQADYTVKSWTRFAQALGVAKTMLTNPEATQVKVDATAADLKTANGALIYTTDQKALDEAIAAAKALKATDYTKSSYATVTRKLQAAQALTADVTSSQVRVATTELNTAIVNTVHVVSQAKFTELTTKYNTAVAKTKASGYVTSKALEAAIAKAKPLLFAKADDTTIITDFGNVPMTDVLEAINELDKVLSVK